MKYVVANWKMQLGIRESAALARSVLRLVKGMESVPEIVICPSFTALAEVHKVLNRTHVHLGSQNAAPAASGAFTGEVSSLMLKDIGCTYVILGHSERRALGESDEQISKRLRFVYDAGLTPILCVGEPESDHEAGNAIEYVEQQLKEDLSGIDLSRKETIIIAYEPIWAIGTGNPDSLGDVVEMHAMIRNKVMQTLNVSEDQVKVIYGGSVDEENAYTFLREQEIDGILVGGASLKLKQFKGILDAAHEVVVAQSL